MESRVTANLASNVEYSASESEGFAFTSLHKTESEETMDRSYDGGEFLSSASLADPSVGVCDVNIDPYLSDQSDIELDQ